MKITRIYIKNLNSLRGDFIIDLEQEPFSNAGIFAIIGPTGAGKSTILDAITLALYGRAARYGNEKPENMMSRGTGECQAEVEFEVPKGRYRASWQMKRARGKADGKLQPAQRFVYDSQGLALAQKISDVDKTIEELTGLDADRFFRSVLLAQGDFVKFLKATPDERATLLESLTGTSIYTEISIKAHKETSERTTALEQREKDLTRVRLLTNDERGALLNQINEYRRGIENNTQKLTRLDGLIAEGNNLAKYLTQQTALKDHLEAIRKERLGLEFDSKRLLLFRSGSPFFEELRTLDQLLKNRNDKKHDVAQAENNALITKRELRAGVDALSEMILMHISEAEKTILKFSETRSRKFEKLDELTRWLETHRRDQALDGNLSRIVEQITSLIHHRSKLKGFVSQQNTLLKDLDTAQQQLKNLQIDKEKALALLKENSVSLEIIQNDHLEILQGKTFGQIQEEILKLERHLNFLTKKQNTVEILEKTDTEIKDLNSVLQELIIKNAESQKKTAFQEETLRLEQEKIQMLKKNQDKNRLIATLHEHRENLASGEACPLCGSLDHPLLANSEVSSSKIADVEKELNSLIENVSEKDREWRKLISSSAKLEETLRNTTVTLEKTSSRAESIKALLNALLQEHGQSEEKNVEMAVDIQKEKTVCDEKLLGIRALLQRAQESEIKKNEIQKSLDKAQHTLELAQSKISSLEERIQPLIAQINAVETGRHHTQIEKENLKLSLLKYLESYGVTVPLCGEEKILSERLEKCKTTYQENLKLSINLKNELSSLSLDTRELERQYEKLRSQRDQLNRFSLSHEIDLIPSNPKKKSEFSALWGTLDEADEGLERLKTTQIRAQYTLDEYKKELSKIQNNHSELEVKLSQGLLETQFETIDRLRSAQLTPGEIRRIQESEDDIKGRFDRCQGQLSQVETELKSLMATDVPHGVQLQEMRDQHTEVHMQTNKMRGLLAICENNLLEDEKNQLCHAELLQEIEADRKRLVIWQKLSNLIGSHDGKTFRKFAQGLSLDYLIKRANIHLSLLNNRYRLKRVIEDELDLEIQDLHQANATRPTASLSGGESFLTSLALALGLSDLAGKNVRIDSLFIDEGFGSLDSETLEIAVQALENLRSKNKTIGVISHIDLVKERISTQIVIEKGSGGVSTMSFL